MISCASSRSPCFYIHFVIFLPFIAAFLQLCNGQTSVTAAITSPVLGDPFTFQCTPSTSAQSLRHVTLQFITKPSQFASSESDGNLILTQIFEQQPPLSPSSVLYANDFKDKVSYDPASYTITVNRTSCDDHDNHYRCFMSFFENGVAQTKYANDQKILTLKGECEISNHKNFDNQEIYLFKKGINLCFLLYK